MVRLWAVGQSEPLQIFTHGGRVDGAMFNRDESRILTWSKRWDGAAVGGRSERVVQTFKHENAVTGAVFNRDESQILTWSEDGTARLWDVSVDENIPPDERILDFQVRSATTLDGSMELRVLNFDQWMAGKRELEAMRTTRKSPK